MYYYNYLLVSNLHSVLKVTKKELSERIYGDDYTYQRKVKEKDNITVQDLLAICNKLRISISHMFSADQELRIIGRSNEYIYPPDKFQEIYFQSSKLGLIYGKQGISIHKTQIEFAKAMNVSQPTMMWMLKGVRNIRVNKLLDICNRYGIHLSFFFDDKNNSFPLNDYSGIIEDLINPAHLKRIYVEIDQINLKKEVEKLREVDHEYRDDEGKPRPWTYFNELFDYFPSIRGVSLKDMLQSVGITNPSVAYNNGNIYVKHFVDICNLYQISARHFLSRCKRSIKEREYYDSENGFYPVIFHSSKIRELSGQNGILGMLQEQWLSEAGISYPKMDRWSREENSTMRMDDLINICNKFNISPFYFIEDHNKEKEPEKMRLVEKLMDENLKLREENRNLKKLLK